MKKISLLLACIMVLASISTMSVSAADQSYTAVYAEAAPTIDGVVDAAWDAAFYASTDLAKGANFGTTSPAKFKLMHDDMYIYALMEYEDLNGIVPQEGKHNGEVWPVGSETCIFAFIDDLGDQKEIMFTSPADEDGALSTNAYYNVLREWKYNLKNVAEGEDGFFAWATRNNDIIVWELRLPKELIGDFDEDLALQVHINDSGAPKNWSMEDFAWAGSLNMEIHDWRHMYDAENFGTLILAAAGEKVEQPVETEPVETEPTETEPEETEPAETEPVETEPVETEPVETEPVETEPEAVEPNETEKEDEPAVTTDATEEPAGSAFPVVPVIIAAVAVLAIVVVVIVLAKKKKAK